MWNKKKKMVKIYKKLNKNDVGFAEDICFVIRSGVACEEHLALSLGQTGEKKFQEVLNRVRERRSLIMQYLVGDNPSAQEHCISKHLSQMCEGWIEVGNRFNQIEDFEKSQRCFKEADECINDILKINGIDEEQKEVITEG